MANQLFNLVAIATKTGERTVMTAEPVTEQEAQVMLSKLTPHKCRTLVVEPVPMPKRPEGWDVVEPAPDAIAELRATIINEMREGAAVWRALGAELGSVWICVDTLERVLWTMPGGRYCFAQLNPHSRRPMVMVTSSVAPVVNDLELATAKYVDDLRYAYRRGETSTMLACDYCELRAQGCEESAEAILAYANPPIHGGAQ